MFSKIKALPRPLKIVSWINLVLAGLTLLAGILDIGSVPINEEIVNVASVIISVLVVLGILQRSRFIRMLTLFCAWIAVVFLGLIFIVVAFKIGLASAWTAIPLAINVATIWGFAAKESKQYFHIEETGDPFSKQMKWSFVILVIGGIGAIVFITKSVASRHERAKEELRRLEHKAALQKEVCRAMDDLMAKIREGKATPQDFARVKELQKTEASDLTPTTH